jgi:hypothetical protein
LGPSNNNAPAESNEASTRDDNGPMTGSSVKVVPKTSIDTKKTANRTIAIYPFREIFNLI